MTRFLFSGFLLLLINPILVQGFQNPEIQSAEDYIVQVFEDRDLVLLGEDHAIKENLEFVADLIPELYEAGVYTIGMEFGAYERQDQVDSLLVADEYDEQLIRDIMFFYNVGWAYQEYLDIYRAAWMFNQSLIPGERPFRILNISYQYNWGGVEGRDAPDSEEDVFYLGTADEYRAELLEREILSKDEKALVLVGMVHAFTKYKMPILRPGNENDCEIETDILGNMLYQKYPKRIYSVLLHSPFYNYSGRNPFMLQPAGGELEQKLRKTDYPIGFDLNGSEFGELKDDSFFSACSEDFRLKDIFDGYIFLAPFEELTGATFDLLFFEGRSWEETLSQMPVMGGNRESMEAFQNQIRGYADLKQRYSVLFNER
ncbi:MAG: hypothetical protein NXI08_10215 [bacterium]|nr:hypothetical protein [bacterium]